MVLVEHYFDGRSTMNHETYEQSKEFEQKGELQNMVDHN